MAGGEVGENGGNGGSALAASAATRGASGDGAEVTADGGGGGGSVLTGCAPPVAAGGSANFGAGAGAFASGDAILVGVCLAGEAAARAMLELGFAGKPGESAAGATITGAGDGVNGSSSSNPRLSTDMSSLGDGLLDDFFPPNMRRCVCLIRGGKSGQTDEEQILSGDGVRHGTRSRLHARALHRTAGGAAPSCSTRRDNVNNYMFSLGRHSHSGWQLHVATSADYRSPTPQSQPHRMCRTYEKTPTLTTHDVRSPRERSVRMPNRRWSTPSSCSWRPAAWCSS